MKKIILSGLVSIFLCNVLLAKDYDVIKGDYIEPSYNKESVSVSSEFREVPKDTYLKIQNEIEKKYKLKYEKDLKEVEKKVENKLNKKYADISKNKVDETNKKILEEIKIKEKMLSEKEEKLKEFKNLENKVKECERQKINMESEEIKIKVEKATQKALSEYLSDYTKNRDIENIKNSTKQKTNLDNDNFVSFTPESKKPKEEKIEKGSLENDLNLNNFKLENLN